MEKTPTDQKDLLSFTMYRHSEPPKRPAKKEIKQKWRDTLHSKRFLFLPNGGDALSSSAPTKTQISKRNQSQLYAKKLSLINATAHSSVSVVAQWLFDNGDNNININNSNNYNNTTRVNYGLDGLFFNLFYYPFREAHTRKVSISCCAIGWQFTIGYCGEISIFLEVVYATNEKRLETI